jgi:hypothetical protein
LNLKLLEVLASWQDQMPEIATLKTSTKYLAVGAACAACCALPLALPLLAGSAALAILGSAGATAAAALAAFLLLRGKPSVSSDCSNASCTCGDTAKVAALAGGTAPIACTLTPGDYNARLLRIRDLAAHSLRTARREPLRLHLTYAPEAAKEVRSLVREEQACCAFMQFAVRDDAQGVHVTITAPEEAREAANDLFVHFAPMLAQESISTAKPKEPVLS